METFHVISDCYNPPTLSSTFIHYNGTLVGSIATYYFAFDTELVGTLQLMCKEDGLWTGENIECSLNGEQVRVGNKALKTNSIASQISSKTSSWKKDSTKRRHQRHRQRQPGDQLFPIQVAITCLTLNIYFYISLYLYITRIT